MEINLKNIEDDNKKEFQDEIIKLLDSVDKRDRAAFNFLNWIAKLNALSKSEVRVNGNHIKLSSNASNLFTFGYDYIVNDPFLGVYHELYANIILDLPIKYIAIKENGIMFALFEREHRVILIVKSMRNMLKSFYKAHDGKDSIILRPHNYKDVLPGKLKEVSLIKSKDSFKEEFLL